MFVVLLWGCLSMMGYGVIRFMFAKWRREEQASRHALWIPASALLYAAGTLLWVWAG